MSKAWGAGRTPDNITTEESGLLRLLEAGEIVLADTGLTIKEICAILGAETCIPSFTRRKDNFLQQMFYLHEKWPFVIIYVERVLGRT